MTFSRRRFIETAASAAALTSVTSHSREPSERPPNVLFLMTDQHKFDILGCMANPLVKTPNLDRLAAQGCLFTEASAVVPYCSPTRAAFCTGRYPGTLGIHRNIQGKVNGKPDPLRLREPTRTFMHALTDRGYSCHHLGKWHLGDEAELTCLPEGKEDRERPREMLHERRKTAGQSAFDPPRVGETLVNDVYMTANTHRCHMTWRDDKTRSKQDLSIIGRSRVKPAFHYESVLADHCIDLLRRHKDEPFSITYSVSPPHALWVVPAPFYDMYDPASFKLPDSRGDFHPAWEKSQAFRLARLFGEEGMREYLRCYYGQVSMMDWCFGRILDELERLGLVDRTLVIFTSDHGDMNGGHGLMDKTVPTCYEEVVRVPLIARLPGTVHAGTKTTVQASSVDIAPTILDLLGVDPLPEAHGRSLRPFLQGQPDDNRPVFAERGDPARNCARMIRTHDWKLVLQSRNGHELYHLAEDPGETTNLAGDPAHSDMLRELRDTLVAHMKRIDDPALSGALKDMAG